MRPAPISNDNDLDTREDNAVADPLSDSFLELWDGTAQRNRAIFSELFKMAPDKVAQNWKDYKVSVELVGLSRRLGANYVWVGVVG